MGFLAQRDPNQIPSLWRAFGHSYLQYAFGTFDQTGRMDSLFSAAVDCERGGNWYNFAVNGACIAKEGNSQGGYISVFQAVTNNIGRGGPYAPTDGAALFTFGINDIGFLGNTTLVRGAFQHAFRACISRVRASTIFENDFQVGTRTSYGAGFGVVSATDFSSGSAQTVHWATALTNANFTLTLPTDYDGEPVAICLVGAAGAAGGTVTWSGTAGVTGTTSVSNVSAAATHCPVVKRVTNLTAANAGQTIIGTVTALDAGGAVMLDCWWLESKSPNPVIVCNIAKLTAAGYAIYTSWTGTEAQKDTDVDNFNSDLASVVAEFDSMVQIADINSVVGKGDTKILFDGLHTTERGSARAVDQMVAALRRMSSNSADGITANFQPPSPRTSSVKIPRLSGNWYTTDPIGSEGTYTPVAGDLFAVPFMVTAARERYTQLAMFISTVGTVTSQLRWGLYDDVGWSGYPKRLYSEATAAGAFSPGIASTGIKTSPASGTGSIAWPLDPGLYWLAIKAVVVGTSQVWTSMIAPVQGNTVFPHWNSSTGAIQNNLTSYKLTGLGTSALPTTFPTGGVLTALAPKILMKLQ